MIFFVAQNILISYFFANSNLQSASFLSFLCSVMHDHPRSLRKIESNSIISTGWHRQRTDCTFEIRRKNCVNDQTQSIWGQRGQIFFPFYRKKLSSLCSKLLFRSSQILTTFSPLLRKYIILLYLSPFFCFPIVSNKLSPEREKADGTDRICYRDEWRGRGGGRKEKPTKIPRLTMDRNLHKCPRSSA